MNGDEFPDIVAASSYTDGADFFEQRLNILIQDYARPGEFIPLIRIVLQQTGSPGVSGQAVRIVERR